MQQGEARRSLGGHVVHHRVAAGIGFQRPLPVARRPLQPGEGLLARHAGQAAAGGNHGIGGQVGRAHLRLQPGPGQLQFQLLGQRLAVLQFQPLATGTANVAIGAASADIAGNSQLIVGICTEKADIKLGSILCVPLAAHFHGAAARGGKIQCQSRLTVGARAGATADWPRS
ncbi:hypothetical protein G6F40_014693 [Rhizopus arrhizus]|nr:hypothetical protein G6F40_014693 [Rhizopus arrhizus]